MASKHLASSLFVRVSRSTAIPQRCLFARPSSFSLPRTQRLRSLAIAPQRRFESSKAGGGSNKIYSFEEVQDFISRPSPDRILIDTREASELQSTGKIPGSINIPVQSSPDAYFLSADEFEDKFGFAQPEKDKEVVFYCKAGVRSRAAAQLARQAGYDHTGEYAGSWMDWEKRGGEREKA